MGKLTLDNLTQHEDTRPPTHAQLTALRNMRDALGWDTDIEISTFKGASEQIRKAQKAINNNLNLGGSINPKHAIDFRPDWYL